MPAVRCKSVGMDSAQLARVGEHLGSRYVDPGKICGSVTLVARGGKPCYLDVRGMRDVERGTPMSEDTILRFYSMTKPITSVALMTLHERGLFSLDDPVHRFIPEWRDLRVWTGGSHPLFATEPARRAMTIRDLLMHTSGLTYDFLRASNLDAAYRKLKVGRFVQGYTLADMIAQLAQLPLEFSPGEWRMWRCARCARRTRGAGRTQDAHTSAGGTRHHRWRPGSAQAARARRGREHKRPFYSAPLERVGCLDCSH